MANNNPVENPIEIINPGNGLPGIAPCGAVGSGSNHGCPDNAGGGGGHGGGSTIPGICDCWFTVKGP